jgi:AraC family transcriptional regulator of arabinose operon
MNNIVIAYQESRTTHSYSPYSAKLQNVRLTLQAAPYERYSPRVFAEQLGISTSYFQHLYTTFFGVPFQSDLINLRMEYAQNLVTASNLTMEQIAEICGYSNEVHFYRQFRRRTGMTPAEYKKSQNGV